jgi:hypothetical protein
VPFAPLESGTDADIGRVVRFLRVVGTRTRRSLDPRVPDPLALVDLEPFLPLDVLLNEGSEQIDAGSGHLHRRLVPESRRFR